MAANFNSSLTARGREMYSVIEQYLSSGLKQGVFCENHGIAYTTFQYWLSRYRADKGAKAAPGGGSFVSGSEEPVARSGFLALHPTGVGAAVSEGYACEMVFPGGIILRLRERPDAAWLLEVTASGSAAR
ncbi:MAG: hypothetical protein R3360_03510 [Alphaproteobacteria bacterium]|nr:hypothetical protein [Alphaproteobacteria bacterium]